MTESVVGRLPGDLLQLRCPSHELRVAVGQPSVLEIVDEHFDGHLPLAVLVDLNTSVRVPVELLAEARSVVRARVAARRYAPSTCGGIGTEGISTDARGTTGPDAGPPRPWATTFAALAAKPRKGADRPAAPAAAHGLPRPLARPPRRHHLLRPRRSAATGPEGRPAPSRVAATVTAAATATDSTTAGMTPTFVMWGRLQREGLGGPRGVASGRHIGLQGAGVCRRLLRPAASR